MSFFSRLRNSLHSRRLDQELGEEMRDHLERRVAQLREQGFGAEDAQRQAALRFGNITQLREKSRDIRLLAPLEAMLQDTRYAWRGMRKSPAFAVTAVLSLALAIGANTAIYSIVDAAMLRPLPVPESEQLFTLAWPSPFDGAVGPGQSAERDQFSYPTYLRFIAAKPPARLAMISFQARAEAQGPEPGAPREKLLKQYISGNAFEILGVAPAVGRLIAREDDHLRSGNAVAVLSHDYWRRRFHRDPGIVGKTLHIDGKAYEICGVARDGFFGIEPGRFVDVWLPSALYDSQAFTEPGWNWLRIVGRLARGASREQVTAQLQPAFHDFQLEQVNRWSTIPAAIRKQFTEAVLRVHPGANGASDFRKTFAKPLWIVLGLTLAVLLIACANVASLLLARLSARSREMAMRLSLGAARGRLVRQLLTESLLLASLAGAAGWLLAQWAAPVLVRALSSDRDPLRFVLALDSRVLLFSIAVSTLAAVLFGLLPAWQSSRTPPIEALRSSAGQAGKLRLGRFLVGIQVACAFCLVMGGAAFLFSLRNLMAVDAGFDPRGVAVLDINGGESKKPAASERQLMHELRKRIAVQPGVEAAAVASWSIFAGGGWTSQVFLPGQAPSQQQEIFYNVSPGYFAALRTPLLAGRDFAVGDGGLAEPIAVIVNQAFARKYFGGANPLGREFRAPPQGPGLLRHVVVGLASNAHYSDLRTDAEPIVYVPLVGNDQWFTLYVRSPLALGSVARLVEREAQAMEPGSRVSEMTTLETLVGNTILRERLLAGVGGAFAFLGLVLAAIGLFGLLNYSVARRTKEIGIRAALGAGRSALVRLILKDLLALMGGGLVAGLAGSLAIMRIFQSLLFGVRPADPLVMAAAAAVFVTAGLVAGGLPARRAAAVDPMVALRQD